MEGRTMQLRQIKRDRVGILVSNLLLNLEKGVLKNEKIKIICIVLSDAFRNLRQFLLSR